MAASIVKVDVVTAQGDLSVAYCESVADYENSRSELYSKLVKALAVFTFVWDAYEIVAKVVNPPSIPVPDRRSGNDKLTARVAFCLRSAAPTAAYCACLSHFQHFLANHTDYTPLGCELAGLTNLNAGTGISFVQRIRNKLAHGAARVPEPDGWGNGVAVDDKIVILSSRIALFTMQALISHYYRGQSFDLEIGLPVSALDSEDTVEIHDVLARLHLDPSGPDAPDTVS